MLWPSTFFIILGSFIFLALIFDFIGNYTPGSFMYLILPLVFIYLGINLRRKVKNTEFLKLNGIKIEIPVTRCMQSRNFLGQNTNIIQAEWTDPSASERIVFKSVKFMLQPGFEIKIGALVDVYYDAQNKSNYFMNFIMAVK
jgi:hypothetical protein